MKFLKVLAEGKVDVSQQSTFEAMKTNHVLYCSRSRDVITAHAVLVPPHFKRDTEILDKVQPRATRMIRELENSSYEEKLKELVWRRKGSEDLCT